MYIYTYIWYIYKYIHGYELITVLAQYYTPLTLVSSFKCIKDVKKEV